MMLNENETLENETGLLNCPHVKDCVKKTRVHETLKRPNFDLNSCDDCKLSSTTFYEVTSEYVYDISYWLCLYCGKSLCGRFMNSHGLSHFEIETSENVQHAVVLNLAQDIVWCYKCNGYVDISQLNEIKQVIKLVKELRSKSLSEAEAASSTSHYSHNQCDDLKSYSKHVRDLVNLKAEKSYMNSVLQCLSKTPYLKKILEYLKEHTFDFRINLSNLKTVKNFDTKTILGKINPATDAVTLNLFETINQLNNSCSDGIRDCYNPFQLQRSIAQIVDQYSGFQKHDSHELIRHLLEIVRTNDFNRVESALKNCLETELQIENKLLKNLAQELTNQLITTETVFKGFLVSTLQCEQCKQKTQRDECFLDLSLPIYTYSTNKPEEDSNSPPYFGSTYGSTFLSASDNSEVNSWKDCSTTTTTTGQQNFYNKKHNQTNQQQFFKSSLPTATETSSGLSKGMISASTATSTSTNNRRAMRRAKKSAEYLQKKESRHCSVNSTNSNTLSPNYNQIELSKTNIKIVRDESPISDNKSFVQGNFISSYENYNETIAMSAHQSENELTDNFENIDEDDEEKSSSTNNDSYMDTQSSSNDTKNNDFSCSNEEKMMDIDCWDDTQRKRNIEFENDECSVTTCLFRFTKAEMLDGANKVVCEQCTKSSGRIIYQKFKKQLLISQPPPVLILHLKRFEEHLSPHRKITKPVTFSMKLDLTPFCWKECRTSSIFDKYLYSLYGIVEHPGTLRSGYYVAYVKVRPFSENLEMIKSQITECSRLENLTAELLISNMITSLNSKLSSNSGNEDQNNFRWFRISDSSYNMVSEKDVLSAQAYLLFYERIA